MGEFHIGAGKCLQFHRGKRLFEFEYELKRWLYDFLYDFRTFWLLVISYLLFELTNNQ